MNIERQERTKVTKPKEPELLLLSALYLNSFSADAQLNDMKFDIEHLATKQKMKEQLERLGPDVKLPISSFGNLCILPEYENRSKGKKTLYEDTEYLSKSNITLAEIEENYSFTTKTDLDWLLDLTSTEEDFRKSYLTFLNNRFTAMKKILKKAMEDGKNLKTISKENYYSSKEISRIISKHFGVDFITLYHAVFNQIVVHTIQSSQTLTDAALSLNMTSQNLSTYSMRHIGTTPQIIKREVHTMKDKSISEVLLILANQPEDKNTTLRELEVDSHYIRALRKAGIPIISVPGRNGGYNLDRTQASVCISWVNNVRRARGIEPPLKTLF